MTDLSRSLVSKLRVSLLVVAALSLLIMPSVQAEQVTQDYLYYADCTLTTTVGHFWTECGDTTQYSTGTTSNWRKHTTFTCISEHTTVNCEYFTGTIWVTINCNGNNC